VEFRELRVREELYRQRRPWRRVAGAEPEDERGLGTGGELPTGEGARRSGGARPRRPGGGTPELDLGGAARRGWQEEKWGLAGSQPEFEF
jgi:hypothetical protein